MRQLRAEADEMFRQGIEPHPDVSPYPPDRHSANHERTRMNVTLAPEFEAMIRERVERGAYNNATEVVQEALRLLDERDRRDRLRAALAVGDEQYARGHVVPWAPDFMRRLMVEAEERTRQGLPVKDDVKP